ncbi:MAG: Bug family tripartite tricarboxylate transporter substrate binding protein [Pseudomonadota bacterium]|jgi:tripartite-type tricarboxylate transporter receptor subunit TctC
MRPRSSPPCRRALFLVAIASIPLATATNLRAADPAYPSRPVRFLIPQSPGGGSDTIGRLVAQRLAEHYGQSFVVDNRPGAAGMLGANIVRQSNPDGYTILLSAIDTITAPLVTRNPPYDVLKDFAPVTQLTTSPNVWLVNPAFAAKSMKDLVEIARAKPRQLDYASSGVGSMQHLGGELLNQLAKIELAHVPYKGGGPALVDLLGGRVPVMVSGTQGALPFIRNGKARALAVTTPRRLSALPDVPTVAEALSLPAYEAVNWQGLFAPAGTTAAVVGGLAEAAIRQLSTPEVRARLAELGYDPVGNTPAVFTKLVFAEHRKWTQLVKAAGIKPE